MKNYLFGLFFLALAMVFPVRAEVKIENFKEYYREKCDKFVSEKYGDDWCNSGNAGGRNPNVVILGDSYSNSMSTMFDEYSLSKGGGIIFEQYARGHCPTLLNYGPDWCRYFSQAIFSRIKNQKSIKTVVLAGVWSDYYPRASYERIYSKEEFEKSFQETILAYQNMGKKVVVFYQTPIIGDPKVCVQRRFQPAEVTGRCYLSRSDANLREGYRAFTDPWLQKMKVEVFDPYLYFCNQTECQLRDGEKIFHTSGPYLSGFGGQFLARKAAPELKKLLGY